MYWQIFEIIFLTFVPLPINPRLKRPDPAKNMWTFECDGFTTCFQEAKIFYTDTLAAKRLMKKEA